MSHFQWYIFHVNIINARILCQISRNFKISWQWVWPMHISSLLLLENSKSLLLLLFEIYFLPLMNYCFWCNLKKVYYIFYSILEEEFYFQYMSFYFVSYSIFFFTVLCVLLNNIFENNRNIPIICINEELVIPYFSLKL